MGCSDSGMLRLWSGLPISCPFWQGEGLSGGEKVLRDSHVRQDDWSCGEAREQWGTQEDEGTLPLLTVEFSGGIGMLTCLLGQGSGHTGGCFQDEQVM